MTIAVTGIILFVIVFSLLVTDKKYPTAKSTIHMVARTTEAFGSGLGLLVPFIKLKTLSSFIINVQKVEITIPIIKKALKVIIIALIGR
ncbi:hypothetical protein GCM10008908_36560 [Clostridium subterminale]|uniref:Uncharacterized protein n=1 Tax=Clostridium subterminale TaxID=1550 RepID=A0ABP3WAA3_CLOSU